MSKIKTEVETANAAYAAGFGDKGGLALPPARGFNPGLSGIPCAGGHSGKEGEPACPDANHP
jgi:hypothetical protein